MQLRNRLSSKTARRTGIVLFITSGITLALALTLPFVSLPLSGAAKASLITVIAVSGELAFAASVALLGKQYVNRVTDVLSVPDAPSNSFFLGAGVVVWAVATLLLRLVGQYVLIPGNTPLTIAAFLGIAIGMVLLMNGLYRISQVSGSGKLLAATLFALPGMLFDAGTVFYFSDVFPNMAPAADSLFAAWLFCGYSFIILSGLLTIQKPNVST